MAFESYIVNLFIFFPLFCFCLVPTSRYSRCDSCGSLLLRCRWDARARTGPRTEKGSRTNLLDIGKNRANPRATRRWTTWKHVASEIVVPWSGGKRNGRRAERTRGDREISFSRNPANQHGPYKAFPLVRYSETASVILILSPVDLGAFDRAKKACFCTPGSDITRLLTRVGADWSRKETLSCDSINWCMPQSWKHPGAKLPHSRRCCMRKALRLSKFRNNATFNPSNYDSSHTFSVCIAMNRFSKKQDFLLHLNR